MPDDPANLEFTPDQMRAMGRAVVARSVAHLATLGTQPICGDVDAAELCRALREPAPEQGAALEPLLDPLFDDWIPRSFTDAGPGLSRLHPGRRPLSRRRSPTSSPTRPTATPASGRRRRRWCSSRPTRSTGCATGWASRRTTRGPVHHRRLDGHLQRHRLRARAPPRAPTSGRGVLYTSDSGAPLGAEVGEAGRHHARPRAARSRSTPASGCGVDALERGDRATTARRADARSSSSRPPARRTPAPSIRSTRSPTSARAKGCGTTSTARTARSSTCAASCAPLLARPVARRLADARSAQGHVPALRHRRAARARRRGAARGARGDRRLPAGDADPDEFYDPSQHGPELSRGFPGPARLAVA